MRRPGTMRWRRRLPTPIPSQTTLSRRFTSMLAMSRAYGQRVPDRRKIVVAISYDHFHQTAFGIRKQRRTKEVTHEAFSPTWNCGGGCQVPPFPRERRRAARCWGWAEAALLTAGFPTAVAEDIP